MFPAIRTLAALGALTLSAWAQPTKPSEPAIWKYSKPDAKALIGINVKKLISQLPASQVKSFTQDSALTSIGLGDIYLSVDQVLISSSSEKLQAVNGEEPPVLIVLKGQFNLGKLRETAVKQRANIRLYKFVEFIYPEKSREQDMHMALVNSETVLLGDRRSLLEAVDRNSIEQSARAANANYQRAAEMSIYNDLWMVMSVSPEMSESAAGGPQAAMMKEVDALELGLSFGDPYRMQVNLNTKTEEAAKSLAAGLTLFTGMAASQKQDPATAEFLKKLKITSGPTTVRVAVSMTRNELMSKMGMAAGGFSMSDLNLKGVLKSNMPFTMSPRTPSTDVAAAVVPPPPPPVEDTKPKVIRIYGLDEGTREIPLNPKD